MVNSYALTYYNELKVTGDDGHYEPMPDSLFPELNTENTNLTTSQLYALLSVYREQQAAYFQNNTGVMDLEDATYSPDSMNLLVRGTLYDKNGQVIMNNSVVWTPYITAQDQKISLGYNYFNNSITAVQWGPGTTIAAYLAVTHSANEMRIYYPSIGSYANIEEIYYNGHSVTNHTLTIQPFTTVVPNYVTSSPTNPNISIDWTSSDMIYLYAGAICLVAGIFMVAASRGGIIKAIGAMLMIAGLVLIGLWAYDQFIGTDALSGISKFLGLVVR